MTIAITTITTAAQAADLIERCTRARRRVLMLGPQGPGARVIARRVAGARPSPYQDVAAGCGVGALLGSGSQVGHFELARDGVLFADGLEEWSLPEVSLLMTEAPRTVANVFAFMLACPCGHEGDCSCAGGEVAARFSLAHRLAAARFDELATVFLDDGELAELDQLRA